MHGALEVRVEYGHRLPFVEVEPIELDRRRVYEAGRGRHRAPRAPTRWTAACCKAFDLAGAGEMDFVRAKLTGRLGPGRALDRPGSPSCADACSTSSGTPVRAPRPRPRGVPRRRGPHHRGALRTRADGAAGCRDRSRARADDRTCASLRARRVPPARSARPRSTRCRREAAPAARGRIRAAARRMVVCARQGQRGRGRQRTRQDAR